MPDPSSASGEGRVSRQPFRRIAVTGTSGLIGRHLKNHLTAAGHEVEPMVRRPAAAGSNEIPWHPDTGQIHSAALEGVDAIVHLAGENVAGGRWTVEQKHRLRASRIEGTRLLCNTLARLKQPPAVLLCASATGIYGSRGDEAMTEQSPPGRGFLAEVCVEWEAETAPARDAGIRVVNLRIGVVLSAEGGALAKMLTPFKMGLGGVIGSGRQYISWIAIDDLIAVIDHLLFDSDLAGPVNAVSPHPVTNRELVKTLGAILHRPTLCWMPATAVRLAFGEMADEMLLASNRVVPARLQAEGFEFAHPRLDGALRHLLTP